jgi:putative ABC transport system permease protein
MRTLQAALPAQTIPAEAEISLNLPVLLFTLGLTAVTTLGCAVIPALQTTRTSASDALRQRSANASESKSQIRLHGTLVVIQVALAVALLTVAGLLMRSIHRMSRVTLGVDATNLLTARLPIASERFQNPDTFTAYLERITERVAALPGVSDVSFTAVLPLQRGGFGMGVQIAGEAVAEKANRPFTFFKPVAPSYFQTMRMRMLQGRSLDPRDTRGSPPVAVISDAFARKYFPRRNPIGERVLLPAVLFGQMGLGPDVAWEVVGVVSDERVGGPGNQMWEPIVYASLEQAPQTVSQMLIVRGEGGSRLTREVLNTVHAINPDQVLTHVMTMEEVKADALGPMRFQSSVLGGFAFVALLLAALGIYGTLAHAVQRRTRELGIRAVLGATGRQLIGHVRSRGMKLVATGLALGVVIALSLSRLMAGFLFGTEANDPIAYGAAALILGVVAWVACTIPARRAAKVDPVICLRCE